MRSLPDNTRRRGRGIRRQFQQLATLLAPRMHQALWQAQDHDVEKTADNEPKHAAERNHGARDTEEIGHVVVAGYPTTAASLKIGRYMPTTMPPTSTPMITMMNGSSRLDNASTALLTSCS